MNLFEILVDAIRNTPVGYFESILQQRNPGPDAKGSIFDEAQDFHSLCDIAVKAEPYEGKPENMMFGCTYIKVPIPGSVGIIALDLLPEETELVLLDEKRTTGSVGGGVDAYLFTQVGTTEKVDFSVAIVGPGKEKDKDGRPLQILWTIHPGHIAPRPESANSADLIGKKVKPAEAKKLGLTVAKLLVDNY
jgi:hypothetical protein